MRLQFKRSLVLYLIGSFIVILITSFVLGQFVTNKVVLYTILLLLYIIYALMLFYVYDKYMKPLQQVRQMINELLDENYQARIHLPPSGQVNELIHLMNTLARQLSERSFQEQMQAEQLSTVIENTQSGLALIDERGYIHLVNPKFLSIFTGNTEEYVGHLYYEVLSNEKIHETVQQIFLYETNIKQSIVLGKAIHKRHLEIIGAPIFDEDQLLKGALLMFYDITELKRLEVMRKDFVANVSHELKTPITAIKGFSETLLDHEQPLEGEHKQFSNIIYEESRRMEYLIKDLLMLSTLEREDYTLNLETIKLSRAIDDVFPALEQKAKQANIIFTADIPEETLITVDEDKLKQVIINIVTNAINYTQKGGTVSLSVIDEENTVHLIVEDTGIGIAQASLPRIFERFYRVDQARSRETGGTGLGLAIAKHIVESHRGIISVESEENIGSTFTVSFPKNIQQG